MSEPRKVHTLEEILDRLAKLAKDRERTSIDEVLRVVGRRSFGPVLLIPGLIAMSPLSGVPGVPTMTGLMILLITGQLLIGREEFWMPQFVLKRSAGQERIEKAIRLMKPVTRFIDRLIKPRLTLLVHGPAVYLIAGFCLLISLIAPLLELMPFVITMVGAAVTAFGLALIAEDGVLAFLAFVFCIATLYFASYLPVPDLSVL